MGLLSNPYVPCCACCALAFYKFTDCFSKCLCCRIWTCNWTGCFDCCCKKGNEAAVFGASVDAGGPEKLQLLLLGALTAGGIYGYNTYSTSSTYSCFASPTSNSTLVALNRWNRKDTGDSRWFAHLSSDGSFTRLGDRMVPFEAPDFGQVINVNRTHLEYFDKASSILHNIIKAEECKIPIDLIQL